MRSTGGGSTGGRAARGRSVTNKTRVSAVSVVLSSPRRGISEAPLAEGRVG
jgi:hypothetical protein